MTGSTPPVTGPGAGPGEGAGVSSVTDGPRDQGVGRGRDTRSTRDERLIGTTDGTAMGAVRSAALGCVAVVARADHGDAEARVRYWGHAIAALAPAAGWCSQACSAIGAALGRKGDVLDAGVAPGPNTSGMPLSLTWLAAPIPLLTLSALRPSAAELKVLAPKVP
jgi:hypothetical protein